MPKKHLVRDWFINHPNLFNLIISVSVGIHFFLSIKWSHINPVNIFTTKDDGAEIALALGLATVCSMTGGFAGLISIYALGSSSSLLERLRREGGTVLHANWFSITREPFLCAFGSLVSAFIFCTSKPEIGFWILELCIFVAIHSAFRSSRLFKELITITHASDIDNYKKDISKSFSINT